MKSDTVEVTCGECGHLYEVGFPDEPKRMLPRVITPRCETCRFAKELSAEDLAWAAFNRRKSETASPRCSKTWTCLNLPG